MWVLLVGFYSMNVQSILVMFLGMPAVVRTLLHMKLAYTGNLEFIFPM